MNQTYKHSAAQRNLFDCLQRDVNCILADISKYISDEDEEISGLHFDVDLVLKRQKGRKLNNIHKKGGGHGRTAPQLRVDHELNHYNPHFYKAHIPDNSRRPFGRLSHAAHFFLR